MSFEICGKKIEEESMVKIDTKDGNKFVGYAVHPDVASKILTFDYDNRFSIALLPYCPSQFGSLKVVTLRLLTEPLLFKEKDIENIWLLDTVEFNGES